MSIYRITVMGLHSSGGAQYNIHHYEFPGYVPSGTELDEFSQELADVYEETLLSLFATTISLQGIERRRVDIGDQPSDLFTPAGWPIVGVATGQSLPSQVAAVLRWTAPTAFPRSARTYLPSLSTASLNAFGNISSGALTVLDGVSAVLEELPVTGQIDAQKVTVQYGGDPVAVTASNIVFARPTSTVWGIQRRRRQGTGI